MGVTFDATKVVGKLNMVITGLKASGVPAMQEITQDLKGKAQRLAPIDTGDLRGSAYAEVTQTATGIRGTVGFSEPYAAKQHEDLTLNHPRGGQAKYLETPFKENVGTYREVLAEHARQVIK